MHIIFVHIIFVLRWRKDKEPLFHASRRELIADSTINLTFHERIFLIQYNKQHLISHERIYLTHHKQYTLHTLLLRYDMICAGLSRCTCPLLTLKRYGTKIPISREIPSPSSSLSFFPPKYIRTFLKSSPRVARTERCRHPDILKWLPYHNFCCPYLAARPYDNGCSMTH